MKIDSKLKKVLFIATIVIVLPILGLLCFYINYGNSPEYKVKFRNLDDYYTLYLKTNSLVQTKFYKWENNVRYGVYNHSKSIINAPKDIYKAHKDKEFDNIFISNYRNYSYYSFLSMINLVETQYWIIKDEKAKKPTLLVAFQFDKIALHKYGHGFSKGCVDNFAKLYNCCLNFDKDSDNFDEFSLNILNSFFNKQMHINNYAVLISISYLILK